MILIKRGAATVATVNPTSSSNMSKAVMGEEQITLVWEAPAFVPFYLGDYITFEGANWTLNKLPTVKKLSAKTWQYNAVFQSTKYELIKAMYLLFDNTDTLPSGEFPLTGTADTFMELLVANLNRVAGSAVWSVGQVVENTDYKNLTFSNEDCLSVLGRLADEFDTEYHVNNHVIHLKKISTEREITLQYGSTLYDIERSSVDSSDVVTRLYPFGSTKNLASNYRGGNSPLRLPVANGNYIENNVNLYGIIEQSKTFDDIYPRLSSGGAGVITSVGNEFTFTDSALDFNVNDYLLDGTTAKVHFNTGECAGYDFEIHSYNNTTKTFVLIANTQENDFTLPTADLKPAVGDKYVLIDIVMPPAYLAAAEAELLAKAQEFISQNSTPKVAYKTTFSSIYAKQNLQNVECGDTVTVYDADMGINEQIRIVKLTKGLTDFWTVQFDLANTVTATRLERIEGNVAAVENTVIVTNQRVNRNNLRAYQQTKELQNMVFDPDGYFDPQNIKPLSIETTMVSVSAKSQIFQLSSLLQPNYAGNPQVLQWSAGLLTHFTISDNGITEWIISQGSVTITGENQTKPLYIYARCLRSGNTGDIYLAPVALKFDEGSTYYYFLIGVLHTPISSVRGISLSYGQTTINGQFITTGVISSIDGATYFNLNTGEIGGNIKFRSASGTLKDVQTGLDETQTAAAADATSKVDAVQVGGRNLLPNSNFFRGLGSFSSNGFTSFTQLNSGLPSGFYYGGRFDVPSAYNGFFYGTMPIFEVGKKFTISAYMRSSVEDTMITWGFERFSTQNVTIGNTWKKVTIEGVLFILDGATALIFYPLNSCIFDITGIKVEFGNKATDWSPATEDIQDQFLETNDYLTAIQADLQAQIDGQVISWFQEYDPFQNNYPASLWTTEEEKNRHANDTFTNTLTGYSWRWANGASGWGWYWISDTATAKALALAGQAQDTADSKRRVFTGTPVPPYEVGDLWVQGASGDFMKCDVERLTGSYNSADWSKSSKYTDDTAVNNLKIGNRNYVLKSLATQATIFLDYGTSTVVTDENYGNVVEYSRPAGGGNFIFQYALSPDVSKLKNTTVTFFVIAKKISESGSFFCGGWMNTYTKINHDSSWIEGVNGWRQYHATFTTDENGIVSVPGNVFGINSIQGTWRFYAVGVVLGNKPVDWTAAPEDTNEAISTAQTTANNAISNISDMFNSNKATPADKVELKRRLVEIEGEWERIYTQGDEIANFSDDTFSDTATDLVNQLTTITANMSTTSDIDGALLSTRFSSYYTKRDELIAIINTAINNKAIAAKAEADAQAYLKEAIAQTTEISGGLLLAAALCARDAQGAVRAYLNGLQSKPYAVGAGVTGWGTGAEVAKSWIDFLGNAKFGNLRIGINGDGTCWIEDTAGVTRLEFSSKAIPALATLLAASGQDTTITVPASSHSTSTLYQSGSLIVANDGSEVTVAGSVTATAALGTGNVSIGVYCYIQDVNSEETYYYIGAINIYLSNNINEPQTLNPQTLQLDVKLTNVPAGTYKLCIASTIATTGTSTANVAIAAGSIKAYYSADNRAMLLGSDGLALIWGLDKYFHMKNGAIAYRGAWDVPAGLGGASINSSGGMIAGSNWGKITLASQIVKSGSNYTITHNIGDTNYSLILTPISTNIPYFSSKSANTIVVTCAGGFDFVLIRTK